MLIWVCHLKINDPQTEKTVERDMTGRTLESLGQLGFSGFPFYCSIQIQRVLIWRLMSLLYHHIRAAQQTTKTTHFTVAHTCHGKANSLEAKTNRSRQKKIARIFQWYFYLAEYTNLGWSPSPSPSPSTFICNFTVYWFGNNDQDQNKTEKEASRTHFQMYFPRTDSKLSYKIVWLSHQLIIV